MDTFNAAGSAICPSYARMILAAAHRIGIDPRTCHWILSPIQKAMVENCAVNVTIVEKKPMTEEEVQLVPSCDMTLCGVNVLVDPKMPEDGIELRYGSEVVGRITNLALPVGYR